MTTSRVDTLQIKPLVTHLGEKGRSTSITSFDDMLKAQKKEKAQTKKTTSADGTSKTGVVYYSDPKTGKRVKYVEAGEENKTSKKTSSASKSASTTKTTSASSMKTTKYDSYFKKAAKKYGVPESLLKLGIRY